MHVGEIVVVVKLNFLICHLFGIAKVHLHCHALYIEWETSDLEERKTKDRV